MSTALTLPAELTIYTATQTREAWLAALVADDTDEPLQAHAAAVAEVDGAGLQLLVSLRRTLASGQRALHLHEPSDVLRTACARAGLDDILVTTGGAA